MSTTDSVNLSSVPDNPNIILQALRYLAARCDGAEAKDGQGFNKPDAWLGRKLAERDYLTEDETIQALTLLAKYGAQLQEGKITLPERHKAVNAAHEADLSRGNILLDGQLLKIIFPYNPKFVTLVKTLKGARFVSNGDKYWTVPLGVGEDALKAFPKFKVSEEARVAIASWEAPKFKGQITLDKKHLVIRFEYDAALVERVKTIKGAKFDKEHTQWTAPLSGIQTALDTLKDFSVDPAVRIRLEHDQAEARAQAERDQAITEKLLAYVDEPLPSGMIPFKHQVEAVRIMREKRRVILAFDMGTGKTLCSLIAAKAFELPVYVICPASLKINWQREADGAGLEIKVYSWAKFPEVPDHDFVLICDEFHYCQSWKAARTQKMLEWALSPHCAALFGPTGTPIKNGRPVNLFPLLKAVRHPLAEDKSAFEKRYCDARPTRFTPWDTSGAAHLDELHANIKDIMPRKTKAECLDLPEKTRVIRRAETSDKAIKEYKARFDKLRAEYRERLKQKLIERGHKVDADTPLVSQADAIVMLNNLRHAASFAKAESAIEIAEEVIEQGGSVVIFTAFKEPGDMIAQALGVSLFSGEIAEKPRQKIIDDFQARQTKAFVGTLGAGNVGITLTAAQTVILVDRPWTGADAEQAESRLHRNGQKNAVTAIWLQFDRTDEMIDELLETKAERIELVLHGKRKTLRGIGSIGELAQEMLPILMEE